MIHAMVVSLGSALVVSGILALSTVGFTLRYAVSGVFDLTYGALMGIAMFVAYLCAQAGLNLWLSSLIAGVGIATVSVLLERLVVRPLLARSATSWVMMIVTFAIGLAVEASVLGYWGSNFRSYTLVGRTFHLGNVVVTADQLWILTLSVVGTLSVGLMLHYTQLGRAMRATATNSNLAENCGIQVKTIRTLTWFMSGFLCGVSGVLIAIQTGSFTYSTWEVFLPLVIAAAIIGGVGRIGGAMAGALLIGVVTALASAVISSAYEDVVALGVLTIVLLARPSGLFVRTAQ
ncbi:MAG TPA: branched-chain amino acid ABC transporter permease [Acidimicrobiales bacterium]|nr:branched-chain amino acid ABC transporter permease [Acidimicrobiales bacterium]